MAKQVQLNTDELKQFVSHVVNNNKYLQENGKIPVAVNIEGEAGIGKTTTILQFTKDQNMDYVKLSLSQLEELGDLVGFPIKEFQVAKVTDDGQKVTKWIPENVMPMYIQQKYVPTGEKRMTHAAPEWIQGKGENGLLILDDYTRADARFMQATMEIIDRQEYVSWKLPKGWTVILTSNPDNGDYQVTSLDEAQKTRFITSYLKFDLECWARWAEENEIDTRCINFMLLHPELTEKRANARSFTTFFNSISSLESFEESLPIIQMIGEGSVGGEFATMFTMFINNKLDKIISPEDTLTKDEAYVMGALSNAVGRDDDFRADISSVIATRLINYSLVFANTKPVPAAMTQRLIKLTTDCDAFTDDLRYYIIKEIVNGNKVKFAPLMQNKDVVKMAVK